MVNNQDRDLATWVMQLRTQRGLTQQQAARIACRLSTLQRIEYATDVQSLDVAQRLADELQMPSDEREPLLYLAHTTGTVDHEQHPPRLAAARRPSRRVC
jgi:transcriptional regulator with XRE-family HTH domain